MYDVACVQDRLEAELGERPSANQIHKAAAVSRTANARLSVVSGLPVPVSREGGLLWSADAIDEWIAHHPRRVRQAAREELALALETVGAQDGIDLGEVVARARAAGLSWGSIAEMFAGAGRPITRQGLQARFG